MENSSKVKSFECHLCFKSFTKASSLKDHISIHSGNKPFQCTECSMSFRIEKYLKRHMSKHTGQYLYTCSVCGKGINDKYHFEEHKLIHTGEKPYSCINCSCSFYYYGSYKSHLKRCVRNFYNKEKSLNSNTIFCSICHQNFDNIISLRIHMRAHADKNPYSCKHCGKSFKFKKHLKSHVKDHNFQCPKCPIQFKNIATYKDHMKKHNRGILHSCSVCKRAFSKRYTLEMHEKTHDSNSRKFYCDYCKNGFAQLGNLTKHIKKYTGKNSYSCPKCPSKYETGCKLREHMQIHRKSSVVKMIAPSHNSDLDENQKDVKNNFQSDANHVYQHQCTVCSKSFDSKRELIAHKFIHSESKRFKCEVCKKVFWWKKNLIRHTLTHTKETRFKCSKCSKGFYSKYELERHDNVHLGIKPFKCEECHKTFFRKSHLNVHMASHSDMKPFSCDFCNTQFCQRIGLKRHLNKNTGKEPYLCDLCPSHFESQCRLKNHLFSTHKKKSSIKALPITEEKLKSIQSNYELSSHLYHCSYCDNKFAESSIYQKHLQCHISENKQMSEKCHMTEKLFKCCRCLERFSDRSTLLSHCCPKSSKHEKEFWDFIHNWSLSFEKESSASSKINEEISVVDEKF